MAHCPALRSAASLCVGAPARVASAVASSGPIIHGTGRPSATAARAASQASSSVPSVRGARRAMTESDSGMARVGA